MATAVAVTVVARAVAAVAVAATVVAAMTIVATAVAATSIAMAAAATAVARTAVATTAREAMADTDLKSHCSSIGVCNWVRHGTRRPSVRRPPTFRAVLPVEALAISYYVGLRVDSFLNL